MPGSGGKSVSTKSLTLRGSASRGRGRGAHWSWSNPPSGRNASYRKGPHPVDGPALYRRVVPVRGSWQAWVRLYRTRSSGQGAALRHQAAASSFRYEDEPVASVFRVVNDDGNTILQVRRNANYKRVRAAWLFFQWTAAATTLLLLISALLFALVRAPAKLFGRMKKIPAGPCATNRREMCGLNSAAWEWRGAGTTSSILVTLTAQPKSQEGPNDLLSTTAIR